MANRRVLLIDPSPFEADRIASVLVGLDVRHITPSDDLAQALQDNQPALVLLDPDALDDAAAAVATIRGQTDNPPPAIALLAMGSPMEIAEQARALGVRGYFSKDEDLAGLARRLVPLMTAPTTAQQNRATPPRAPATPPPLPERTGRATTEPQIRILVVDDERHNTVLVERALHARREFAVMTAHSGSKALALLQESKFDLLVLDQRMPEMTGVELLVACRNEGIVVPTVMCTAYTDDDAVVGAKEAGLVHGLVTKPWAASELRTAIDQVLTGS